MRRRLLILIACLTAGAALSVATAWGAILWRVFIAKPYLGADEGRAESGPWPLAPPAEGWPEPDSRMVTRTWGYERIIANGAACETPEGLLNLSEALEEWRERSAHQMRIGRADVIRELKAAGWTETDPALNDYIRARLDEVRLNVRDPEVQRLMAFRRRSGWPILCMESSWVDHSQPGTRSAPVDPLGSGWTTRMYWERGVPWPKVVGAGHFNLPLRLVPWLFAANTGGWALAAWFAFSGIWMLRRRLRNLHGLCPTCRYPIGTSPVCTECGALLHAKDAVP